MILPILALGGLSLLISFFATWILIHLAPQIGLLDKPGHRKIHSSPKPLGGGVAIVLAIAIPMLIGLLTINLAVETLVLRFIDHSDAVALVTGGQAQTKLSLGLLGGMLILHALGLMDDRKPLGPYIKLMVQIAVAAALVLAFDMRALTALDQVGLGRWPSVVVTVLWIVAITNAFNFLDNMDGLSAGVAAVCTTSFLITAIIIEQWFVAATLALLLGSLLGFLFWNFPPAKIFMGDSGSLVIGFILGVLTVRTTYLPPGQQFASGWYSVLAPLIVLAVPLYDLIVVSFIRIARGKSPFVGDTNHFSHRLVARGMSRRTAVLSIYLVTAATAIAAVLLPHVQSGFGAVLIFAQTILILGVVALLEQHPLPPESDAGDPR